ncbi:hypothetical protein GGI02_000442 [Coemansia sp. RSA 2322]|nr:hypothetical protein GGI02_000442 [Coemansia sp. RSA 2322]
MAREHSHLGGHELLRLLRAVAARDTDALATAGGTLLGGARARAAAAGFSVAAAVRGRSTGGGVAPPSLPAAAVAGFRQLARCHGHKFATFCVLFDRTGRRMITGSDDYLIKVWCARTGYLINTFKGHQDVITDVALNSDNTLLASASSDGTARIWNLRTGEPRAVLVANPQGRPKSITSVKFSPAPHPELRLLATTCDDGMVRLYRWDRDALTVRPEPMVIDPRPEPRDAVSAFAFNHTGSRFAVATVAGYISVYSTIADAADGRWGSPRLIRRIAAHDENITTLVYSPDGSMMLSGSRDGSAKVWDCAAADPTAWTSVRVDLNEPVPAAVDIPDMLLPQEAPPPEAAPIPPTLQNDSAMVVDDGPSQGAAPLSQIELVADSLTPAAAVPRPAPAPAVAPALVPAAPPAVKRIEANQVAWVCDNSRVIVSNNLGTVLVFDPRTGAVLWRRRAHSMVDVYVLIPHPADPRIAVSGGYDGRAIVWNVATGDILHEIRVGEQLYDGAFSEDGQTFALASDSGAATLFGLGATWAYDDARRMPEQMFANDYTATIMDANRFVADQQTQIPSYLVPHSALMDFDGRVYRHQRGPRFGLSINMGVDSLRFAREEVGRRAALDVELEYAHLDFQAAQDPLVELHPARPAARSRRNPPTRTRVDVVEDVPEAELPPIFPVQDDSDDEEYRAADDDDEEEEPEAEEEDDDDEDDDYYRVGVRDRLSWLHGLSNPRARDFVIRPRSREQEPRSRHGPHPLNNRATRSAASDAEAAASSDLIDVDGEITSDEAASSSRRRRLHRRGNTDASPREVEEIITSDEDFQPSTTGLGASSHRPRRTGMRARTAAATVSEATSVATHRQTRSRRIASDSEDEDGEEGARSSADNSEIEQVTEVQQPDSSDVDIAAGMPSSPEPSASGSEFSDSLSHTTSATPARGQRGRRRQDNPTSPNVERAGGETPQSRSLRARSGSYERPPRRNILGQIRGREDFVSQMADATMEDRAAAGPSHAVTRNGRVPRSNDNIVSADNDQVLPETGRRRQTRGAQLDVAVNGTGPVARRSATTASTSLAAAATVAMRAGASGLYQPTDWILATTPSTVPYRPQVGDIIAYFREGHADFWQSPMRCKKLSEKLLPYHAVPTLSVAAFGKVVGLRYAVGPPTYCTVKIQLLKLQTIEELDLEGSDSHELTRRFVQVQYHDCDGVPDFLILYSRYRASLRRSLKCGDSVSVLFDEDQAHSAVITGFRDIKPTMRQTSVTRLIARNPWKSIVVEWAAGSSGDGETGTEQVSPWELVHDDDDDVAAEIPADTKETLLEIVDNLRDEDSFEWFVKNVDHVTDYPDYLLHVAYPMCLDTIYDRLHNDFYRHTSAVLYDMMLIQENADTFNDPGTPVPTAAQNLTARYTQLTSEAIAADGHQGSAIEHNIALVPAERRSTRQSRLSSGQGTVKREVPLAMRPSRKRKTRSVASRSGLRISRRRVDYGSDESDFMDQDSEDEVGDGISQLKGGRDTSDEEEDEGYSDNEEEDDDDLYS